MKQLIAFDIGIKNMAYCFTIIDDNNELIVKSLNKIDLNSNKNNIQNIIDNTIDFLDTLLIELDINMNEELIILIECQMTSIMRTIQTCINTYFKIINKHDNLNIKTIYVSPKHKLKIMDKFTDIISTDKYKQNKIDSIFYTKYLLTDTIYKNNIILEQINSFKKKDDLCDAFLMCIYFHNIK